MPKQTTCSRGHTFTKDKDHPVCPKCWPGKYKQIADGAHAVDEYIARFPDDIQHLLTHIRKTIREAAPDATETISYGIPTFDLFGKHMIHYAGFQKHISIFPTGSGVAAFADKLKPYTVSKGTIQFPLTAPIPYALIKEIAAFRIKELQTNIADA